MTEYIERLKEKVEADPRSISQIERDAQLGKGTLAKTLSGSTENPKVDILLSVSDALNVSAAELFGGNAGNGGLDQVPADRIFPSPLNPRRSFDETQLVELSESIAGVGILEPLLVRSAEDGRFELVAGERRWRAAQRISESYELPVIVRDLTDAELVEIGLVENLQREGLRPMDEAEAFQTLVNAHGWKTADIAARVGKTPRYVQKRIALAERLAPEVRDALAADDIMPVHALAIVRDPSQQRQKALLDWVMRNLEYGERVSERDILEEMTGELPPLAWALFDRDEYTGALVLDEDETEPDAGGGWFDDVDQALELQRKAIDATIADLEKKWPWVDRYSGYGIYGDYEDAAETAGDGFVAVASTATQARTAQPGAVVHVTSSLGVTIHENMVKRQRDMPLTGGSGTASRGDAADRDESPAKTPQPEFVNEHLIKVAKARTGALRIALDTAEDGDRIAKILTIAALTTDRFDRDLVTAALPGHITGDDGRVANEPLTMVPTERLRKAMPEKGTAYGGYPKDGDVIAALLVLQADQIDQLFRAAVAKSLAVLPGYQAKQPTAAGQDEHAAIGALAAALDLDMAEHVKIDEDYLAKLRKPSLARIIVDNALEPDDVEGLQKRKLADLRAVILQGVKDGRIKPDYVPLELRFAVQT